MITTLMNQKRGLNRLSKLPDGGDPWAPNNLMKPGAKEKLLKPSNDNNIVYGFVCRNQDIISMQFLDTLLQMPKMTIWV